MNAHFYDRVAQLERERASFAIATVVARRSPVSSHLGDRALVFADGRMEGFVGGSCSRDIVRRQALGAIGCRQPVLLQIRNAGDDAPGTPGGAETAAGASTERVVIPMSCSSEGAVDVYIEPRVPLRPLLVVGFTPVAQALAQLAAALEYDVTRVVIADELGDCAAQAGARYITLADLPAFVAELDPAQRAALVAIVASQGHYDELALDVLRAFDLAFVGLLASRRRAAAVLGVLAQQGASPEQLAAIRTPVGLAIGARNPGEVAVSILAEIIAAAPMTVQRFTPLQESDASTDPVCGMHVDASGNINRHEHAGRTFFFCCASCRAAFAAEPARYLIASGSA